MKSSVGDALRRIAHLVMHPDHPGYFEPTPEWDKNRVNDRLWS
jgi:hypothetical protein